MGYINKLISDERIKNPGNQKLNNLNSIQFDFSSIKKIRTKADYENDDVTEKDIAHLKKKLEEFDKKYSMLKQM